MELSKVLTIQERPLSSLVGTTEKEWLIFYMTREYARKKILEFTELKLRS